MSISRRAALASPAGRNDHIFRFTRVLAALIVPVLVVAFLMLYLFPQDSERLFAWPIRPTMSAMMLGGTYLGGAYFFTRVVFARRWHTIKDGFLPVAAFAGYLGIATLLHWDRFTPGHVSFILWAFLYFTLPFVLVATWFANRRNDPHTPEPGDSTLPPLVRTFFAVYGLLLLVVSLLLFLLPALMIPTWPWTLTPLTARVLAAMFVLPGAVSLNIARELRWSAARFILQAQVFALVLILGAIGIARGDFDWSRFTAWLFTASIILTFLVIVVVYTLQERRTRSQRR